MKPRKVLIIGGTGHIGGYLVPRLVQGGFEVHVVARHAKPHYANPHLGWTSVHWIIADRTAEEKTDAWSRRMREIEVDVVIDLMCFTLQQQQVMFESFRDRIDHFLHCGSVWSYGAPERLPYEECDPRRPFIPYGERKAEIEEFLLNKFRSEGFPATIIHPGNICGPKWMPVDPQGSRDNVEIYRQLATGQEVLLTNGNATLHHVHGDDVAQLFELAVLQRQRALGEAFSAVAARALSLIGCCHAVAGMFGRQANIRLVSLDEIERLLPREAADCIRDHVNHSSCCSIAKTQRLLGYQPRYTSEQIYAECVEYLLESGRLKL